MIANRYIILFFLSFLITVITAKNRNYSSLPIFQNQKLIRTDAVEKGNYIVVGAYKYEKNAKRRVIFALKKGFHGRYFFNIERQLFYVYVHRFKRRKRAFKITKRIQRYRLFDDVWVFSVGVVDTENNIELEVKPDNVYSVTKKSNSNANSQHEKPPKEIKKKRDLRKKKKRQIKDEKNKLKNEDELIGNINTKNKRKEKKDKKSKRDTRVKQKDAMKVDDIPTLDSVASIEKLKKAEKGEFVVFDKLLFHKSSAILKSKAREDLSSLGNFLKKNISVQITIHGHTNGKFRGDIVLLKEGSDKYYTLSRKNIIAKGNEKRLSEERALLLKRFLVDSGIEADRIDVKGWGAKKMLYPKEHFKSAQNRRVEIEIIEK